MGWLEKQNDTTKAWISKQPLWHTWEVVVVGLCGILVGVLAGKICMIILS